MQHIQGIEREIIEAYRKELTHDIWGNPQKLKEWVLKKFNELAEHNYTSSKLTAEEVTNNRNGVVAAWAETLNDNLSCQNNPFLKLKIMKSVIGNLSKDNAQLPPPINPEVLNNTISIMKRNGSSFLKTYLKLLREFGSDLNVKSEAVSENGIIGKWFSIKVPSEAEAKRSPGFFNRVKEFIAILSQRSNWCTRTPNTVGRNYPNCDFHIFVDQKGIPQLCLVGHDSAGGWFKDLKGGNQYAPINQKYKELLKTFLIRHNLQNADFGGIDTAKKNIMDFIS